MKRSPPPQRRTPIARQVTPIARGGPPKPISDRRLSEQDRRAEVVRLVHLRDRKCQAGAVHALARVPCKGTLDAHEIINRSQWARGYLDADNVILVCRSAHSWITSHPTGAHALALHLESWERDRLIGGGKVSPPESISKLAPDQRV